VQPQFGTSDTNRRNDKVALPQYQHRGLVDVLAPNLELLDVVGMDQRLPLQPVQLVPITPRVITKSLIETI
jgi:hypothetical protein